MPRLSAPFPCAERKLSLHPLPWLCRSLLPPPGAKADHPGSAYYWCIENKHCTRWANWREPWGWVIVEKVRDRCSPKKASLTNWQTPAWTEESSREDTHVTGKTKSSGSCSTPGGQWQLRGNEKGWTRKTSENSHLPLLDGQYSVLSMLVRSLKKKKKVASMFSAKKEEGRSEKGRCPRLVTKTLTKEMLLHLPFKKWTKTILLLP